MPWNSEIYPTCSGQGWTAGVVYLPPPDHAYQENPAYLGHCIDCDHTEWQHDPADPHTDVLRILSVSVLNMTSQQQRVEIGDYTTSDDSAWQSPWIAVGDDREYECPYWDGTAIVPGSGGGNGAKAVYMHPDGHPYRVRCS